ncbi:SH3 domain-containing protein [Paraburkholderia agricolaris]|uniref:SH3 domain-containing protein n=1 Tax=Paraburkholderia agricolaris TaxID=2152888 RepID=A0ABW8ZIC7_9BURK
MKQHFMPWLYAAAGLLALPAVASAQSQAYTNSSVNVRAGPARDYPVVTQLPGGVPVTVMGCISGYQWCDVAAPNLRGWVYAGRLSYPYQGSNVPVTSYGTVIGLPIVTFSIGTYWGNYYRGRPWYNQRSRWANHPPPPPPRPGAGRPPGGRPPGGPPPGNVGGRPPPGNVGGRPPGNRPPGNAGSRPPGGQPPGNAGGRPPGGQPPDNAGGRPPGGQPPGNAGGRPPGGQPPGNAGGRPPGGRPPGGQQGGGNNRPGGPSQGGGGRPPGGGNG